MSRKSKVVVLLLVDSLIILLANLLSYVFLSPYTNINAFFVVNATVLQIALYLFFGGTLKIFTRINRYTNINEMFDILISMTLSGLITLFCLSIMESSYSRRYVTLNYLISVFVIIFSRFIWRTLIEYRSKKTVCPGEIKRTLVIGAGEAGRILVTSLNHSASHSDLQVIGFIDDAPDKLHTYLAGIRVLGTVEDIPQLVVEYQIDILTIAIPSLAPKELQKLLNKVTLIDVPVTFMPSIEEIAAGNITTSRLKSINVIDLLGREEVDLDMQQLTTHLENKVVLVTGAGGSIGSEICRQLACFYPKKIILLGHGEHSIYQIEKEMKRKIDRTDIEVVPVIADIQDRQRIFEIVELYKPHIIYHAAAHKHVPLMECNPSEAVKNNIYGSKNVAEAAKENAVENFVMISTDKAVNPPNVMGATKRIAEMIVTELNKGGETNFCAVRFGNVLGSRGSVIPVFEEQIKNGGPITITDYRMTRYFMTIPEASKLVIQASALAKGGEIFILDMGQPVQILDLAKNMIRLSGYREDQIDIIETGIRPGEKLYEELLVSKERAEKQVFDKIFVGNVKGFSLQEVLLFIGNLPEEDKLVQEIIRFANDSSK